MPKRTFDTKPTCTTCRKATAFLASAALIPWIETQVVDGRPPDSITADVRRML